MASSLRECVCGCVGCGGGEICLLNQYHKQRTPQPRASCPDRRSDREDGTEKRHTGAQRGAFSSSTTSGYNLSTHPIEVPVTTMPKQRSENELFDQNCVWRTFGGAELHQHRDSGSAISAWRPVSMPLVPPVLSTDRVTSLLRIPSLQESSRSLRHSPGDRERLGSHMRRRVDPSLKQVVEKFNRSSPRESSYVHSESDYEEEVDRLVRDNDLVTTSTPSHRQQRSLDSSQRASGVLEPPLFRPSPHPASLTVDDMLMVARGNMTPDPWFPPSHVTASHALDQVTVKSRARETTPPELRFCISPTVDEVRRGLTRADVCSCGGTGIHRSTTRESTPSTVYVPMPPSTRTSKTSSLKTSDRGDNRTFRPIDAPTPSRSLVTKRQEKESGVEICSGAGPRREVLQSGDVDHANARPMKADLRRDAMIADIARRVCRPLPVLSAEVQPPFTYGDCHIMTSSCPIDSDPQHRPRYSGEVNVNKSPVLFRMHARADKMSGRVTDRCIENDSTKLGCRKLKAQAQTLPQNISTKANGKRRDEAASNQTSSHNWIRQFLREVQPRAESPSDQGVSGVRCRSTWDYPADEDLATAALGRTSQEYDQRKYVSIDDQLTVDSSRRPQSSSFIRSEQVEDYVVSPECQKGSGRAVRIDVLNSRCRRTIDNLGRATERVDNESDSSNAEHSDVGNQCSRRRRLRSNSATDAVKLGNNQTPRGRRDISMGKVDRPRGHAPHEKREHSKGHRKSVEEVEEKDESRGVFISAAGGAGDPSDDDSNSGNDRRANRKRADDRQGANKNGNSGGKSRLSSSDNDQLSERDSSRQHRRRSSSSSDDGKRRNTSHRRRRESYAASNFTHKMKPGTFDGTTSLETFLAQFRTCVRHNAWSSQDRRDFLMNSLRGEPAQLIWDSGDPDELTYEQLEERLRARFGSTGMAEKFRAELQTLRQRKEETLSHLHSQVCRLMALAYPGATDSSLRNVIARDYFLAALTDRALALKIREREPVDLDSAYRLAIRQEAYMISAADIQVASFDPSRKLKRDEERIERRVMQLEKTLKVQTQLTPEFEYSQKNELDQLRVDIQQQRKDAEEARKELDRYRNEVEESKADARRRELEMERDLSCFRHLEQQLNEARERIQVPLQQRTTVSSSENRGGTTRRYETGASGFRPQPHRKCFNCNKEGHFSRDCPEKRKSTAAEKGTDESPAKEIRGASADQEDEECDTAFIRLRVNGFPTECLLDTGAQVTLIPHSVLDGIKPQKVRQKVHAANGTPIPLLGKVTLKATHGDHVMNIDGLVTRHVSSVILGLGWLRKHRAVWNFEERTVRLEGRTYELHAVQSGSLCRHIVVQSETTVPPMSEVIVLGGVVLDWRDKYASTEGHVWSTVADEPVMGLYVSRAVIPDRLRNVPTMVMNITRLPIKQCDFCLASCLHAVGAACTQY